MDELTKKNSVLAFLKQNFVMNAAICADNKPFASVLLYYVDDDFNFYFASHTDSYKVRILKENPRINLTVWQHNQMHVQADGLAEEVTEDENKLHIVDMLAESASKSKDFWPPLFRIKGQGYSVFKIKVTWMRMLDLVQNTITQVDSPFTVIDTKTK